MWWNVNSSCIGNSRLEWYIKLCSYTTVVWLIYNLNYKEYVTGFAKRDLPHRLNLPSLKINNLKYVKATYYELESFSAWDTNMDKRMIEVSGF